MLLGTMSESYLMNCNIYEQRYKEHRKRRKDKTGGRKVPSENAKFTGSKA